MKTPDAPFEEPWQAQLFALTVALNEAGHFTWSQWAETFGPMVQSVEAEHYWQTWSEALVLLLASLDIAEADQIRALTVRWQDAARATPHGTSITLDILDHSET